ncbi:MAG: hypothetical protein K2P92_01400 [Bdellovibrionaceae bacterium]|nr:hypothetical protein [Pseudobdellovibrionaceae bacterium]
MNKKDIFKKLSQKYSSPEKVQKYLRSLKYNNEEHGETLRSAHETYKAGKAHCLEAAFLAAAILEQKGFPPLVMSLESIDNLDHVIFVYQKGGKWGSVARSRDEGLHGRKAVFRTPRDLALSYYESYIDKTGCITGFQVVNLDESKSNWRSSSRNVWKAENFLIDLRHSKIPFDKKKYKRIHARYLAGYRALKEKFWL